MYTSSIQIINECNHRYVIRQNSQPLTFSDVLGHWYDNAEFRAYFNALLRSSPFNAYRWETPSVSRTTIGRLFEFVLVDAPELARASDAATFSEHFDNADKDGIAVFDNLGGDASLVVPTPHSSDSKYDHLASFVRTAPDSQSHALWRTVSRVAHLKINDRRYWLSTAGDGVAWVHVRLDTRPKYYRYKPFKELTLS